MARSAYVIERLAEIPRPEISNWWLKRSDAAIIVICSLLMWPLMVFWLAGEAFDMLQPYLSGLSIGSGWKRWWDQPLRKSRGE